MPLRFQKTRGSYCIEKLKYQVSNVCVKSKIVTFASQRIIEFTQFLTRPDLTCSVAKTDRRFFFGFNIPRNHFKLDVLLWCTQAVIMLRSSSYIAIEFCIWSRVKFSRIDVLKVAQNSFQHFLRRTFWLVIITTPYQLMLQSWYQNTAQSLVNTLVLFSWHNRLP